MPKKVAIGKIAEKVIQHPDKDELIAKLAMGISSNDIEEWIKAKYDELNEKQFILSKKEIDVFKEHYFDFYQTISANLTTLNKNRSVEVQLREDIQGTPAYHKALEKYLDNEIDIKSMVKKLVVNAEARISQMFDILQEDPQNFRSDRTLIEWFNTLGTILEKYDTILNGSPEQINIQNNINIQVVDKHINIIYDIIREILERLDYDTSLMFIETFNERMQAMKSTEEPLPQDIRLVEANILSETITKLDSE